MRGSIAQRIVFGFLIALVLLLAVGGVSYRNLHALKEHRRLVTHTLEVLQTNERLFNRLTDSASLARGFALTGNESQHENFTLVAAEVDAEFESLRKLTTDNPRQQERLHELAPLIVQRQSTAAATVAFRQANAPDREIKTAEAVVQGTRIMDRIRKIISDLENEERRLLDARRVAADDAENLSFNTLVYGTGIALFLLGVTAYFVVRSIRAPLFELTAAAARIGRGDYGHRVRVDSQDELGRLAVAFSTMAAEVEERQNSLANKEWLSATLAKFGRIFEERRSQSVLCQSVLAELAAAVEARHSVLYLPEETASGVVLQLRASYAFDNPWRTLAVGQGLAGQCFLDRRMTVLREIPADYFKINSALGSAAPTALVVLPSVFDNQVKAVIELASFAPLTEIQIEFLRKFAESFGVVLSEIAAVQRTEQLLEQSRALTEKLQTGQRELNERNHELQVQTERLRRSEQQLQDQQVELKQANEELEQGNEELQQTNAEMEEKTVLIEEQKTVAERAARELQQARAELEDKVRQLAQTSRYKSEFLANMSHELRTPLNSLLILSKVLADNLERTLTEKQVTRAKAIHSSGNDLLELINDILDLAKIEAGSVDVEFEATSVSELTRLLDSTFRHMVEGKGLEFCIQVEANAPQSVQSDVRRLQQILKNLLANACKFTQHGSVTLKVASVAAGWPGDHDALNGAKKVVAFSVVDTGIGIPADRQQIIFEAFQQADVGTSRKFGGTGLGLSISRELTRLLGGALTLQSQERVGSTFTLFIPVERDVDAGQLDDLTTGDDRKKASVQSASSARTGRTFRDTGKTEEAVQSGAHIDDDRATVRSGDRVLLVIEDDARFARILADFARDKGFKVLLAGTAQSGIDLALQYRPTAITLDLLLPDNDGWLVLDRIKNNPETRHIPLHVISVEEQRERSLKLGAVSYLQKPVSGEAIERALRQTIDFVNRPVKNLLIVEDDERQRQSIVELIGNGDVLATAVGSGAEALKALAVERFDCLVLDLGLPDMSGSELLQEMQRRLGEDSPPVIIYTGKTLTRREETELRRVSDAIIVKDVNSPERLLAETALFLHRVQSKLPESKRRLIELIRKDDPLLAKRKVLVVDDDVRNIFAITAALESHHMDVVHAESGKAGLEMLLANPTIDVILMDVMMPEMDGYEAIRRIRSDERFVKTPIIAVTAKAMKGDRERCLQAGASDYITKPVDMDQLRSLLRVWLYR